MLHNRGQEELVGFVLVVAIVAISGLILIGLVMRLESGGSEETRSADIAQFLESLWQASAACHLSAGAAPATLSEIAASCVADKGTKCREGGSACSVLNATLHDVIVGSWGIGTEAQKNGYEFDLMLTSNRTRGAASEPMLALKWGACKGNYRSGEHLQPGKRRGTTLVSTLKICT